ncbi:MAG TPA: DUF1343 domain-containing protein [Balneolaceae bacterium]
MTLRKIILVILLFLPLACTTKSNSQAVKTGAEVLLDKHLDELEGKRVGLVMNPTARVEGVHMLDTLLALDVNVTVLFAPEHGFRGDFGAGEVIKNGIDQATGLPVFSLYGEIKKPSREMLQKVDLLLFDMQDVGARFYTYNVTLGNILEAAGEHGVPVWVLDRPNPAGGNLISGWMMHEEHQSFIGAYPIPMAHGMTLGELAKMMVGEQWIQNAAQVDLRVIEMKGWNRSTKWPQTGLKWIPPSPNLPTFKHAYAYLGTVLFEGTSFSEGRGTTDPFLKIGSPGTQISDEQITRLDQNFSGVSFERISFTPKSMPGKALYPDHEGELCHGVKITVTDPDKFNPVELGMVLLKVMLQATPGGETTDFIELLSGIDEPVLLEQLAEQSYKQKWEKTAKEFSQKRAKYLLYD